MNQRSNIGDIDLSKEEQLQFEEMMRGSPPEAEAPAPAAEQAAEPPQEAPKEAPADLDEPEIVSVGDDGRIRDSRGRYVNHGAFHQERVRRKESDARASAAEIRAQKAEIELARMAAEYKLIAEAHGVFEQPQNGVQKPAETPNFQQLIQEDPLREVVKAREESHAARVAQRALEEKISRLEGVRDQYEMERSAQGIFQGFAQEMQEAKKSDPEINEKLRHVVDGQRKLMAHQLGHLNESQREQLLTHTVLNVIRSERAAGRSPVEFVKMMATQYGYQPKPAGTNAPPAAPPSALAQKIDNINRGQRAAASLSGIEGGTGDIAESARQLAAMTEEEYAERAGKMSKRDWERRVLGRD